MTPSEVLDFWLKETPAEQHFRADPALDAEIRRRFEIAWEEARNGAYAAWEYSADGALALIILLDQFPRNMFRGTAKAFATDALAREVAERAIANGFDLAQPEAVRSFFYLPLMHAEDLERQDLCLTLTRSRLGETHFSYPYAVRHRDVIARFGRFPARNAALGRPTTPEEAAFLRDNPQGF